MARKITVEIPENYLLCIAILGNTGDGRLSKKIQIWAEKACNNAGLQDKVIALHIAKLKILRHKLAAIVGEKKVAPIDRGINAACEFFGYDPDDGLLTKSTGISKGGAKEESLKSTTPA